MSLKINVLLNEKGQVPQAEALYAWISVDGDQFEGIIANVNPPMPFISLELRIMEAWAPIVQQIANAAGKKARLVEFKRGKILQEVG